MCDAVGSKRLSVPSMCDAVGSTPLPSRHQPRKRKRGKQPLTATEAEAEQIETERLRTTIPPAPIHFQTTERSNGPHTQPRNIDDPDATADEQEEI